MSGFFLSNTSTGAGSSGFHFEDGEPLSLGATQGSPDISLEWDTDVAPNKGIFNLNTAGDPALVFDFPDSDGSSSIALRESGGNILCKFDSNGGAIFNEEGNDADFRVEASGSTNALFVQGSDGYVGVNIGIPIAQLHVNGNTIFDPTAFQAVQIRAESTPTSLTTGVLDLSVASATASAVASHTSMTLSGDVNNVAATFSGITGPVAGGTTGNTSYSHIGQCLPDSDDTNHNYVIFRASVASDLGTNTRVAFENGTNFDTALNLGSGSMVASVEEITATSDGVAASLTTITTKITTNGDTDLDNVTLANGTDGQVKIFSIKAVGNAADSVKITPANMIGGTQITFSASPLGLGCIMEYDASATGWVVVANNGGVIA